MTRVSYILYNFIQLNLSKGGMSDICESLLNFIFTGVLFMSMSLLGVLYNQFLSQADFEVLRDRAQV